MFQGCVVKLLIYQGLLPVIIDNISVASKCYSQLLSTPMCSPSICQDMLFLCRSDPNRQIHFDYQGVISRSSSGTIGSMHSI
jgi:hypothetical protein